MRQAAGHLEPNGIVGVAHHAGEGGGWQPTGHGDPDFAVAVMGHTGEGFTVEAARNRASDGFIAVVDQNMNCFDRGPLCRNRTPLPERVMQAEFGPLPVALQEAVDLTPVVNEQTGVARGTFAFRQRSGAQFAARTGVPGRLVGGTGGRGGGLGVQCRWADSRGLRLG
jgi:hypothetical protein